MNGAHIGGQLDCSGATITNFSGPVLHGERLKINDNVLLSGGFTAVGAGEQGAVRLSGAHIGGQLDCSGATSRTARGLLCMVSISTLTAMSSYAGISLHMVTARCR